MNTLQIIRNSAGVAVALHITGQTDPYDDLNQPIDLHEITLGEYANGTATISFPYDEDRDTHTFTFTLDTNPNDGELAGKVAYDALAALLTHTTHAHGDPAPVIDDPLMARIALLEAKLNAPVKVFDELKLEVYKENGKVIGHEWRLEMADNSDTGFAANAHFHGILPQTTGDPIVYIQYFDLQRNITAEVRARCATNHYAGFRYLLNGSAVSDQLYTGAEAETLLNLADQ